MYYLAGTLRSMYAFLFYLIFNLYARLGIDLLTSYVKTVLIICRFSSSGRLDVKNTPVFQPEIIITKSGVIRQATADVVYVTPNWLKKTGPFGEAK